jgi:hypothetical protein
MDGGFEVGAKTTFALLSIISRMMVEGLGL